MNPITAFIVGQATTSIAQLLQRIPQGQVERGQLIRLEQQFNQDLRQLAQRHEEERRQFTQQREEERRQLERLTQRHEEERRQLEQQLDLQLEQLTQRHEEERRQLEQQLEQQLNLQLGQLQQQFDLQLGQLEQQFDLQLGQLMQCHEEEREQFTKELDRYKSADFQKWTILRNDDAIKSLLREIGDKYPGTEMEKLRAEARDKFKIDSGKYNLAITGKAGVGKSTLINAIRGLSDYDHGAAEVNIKECTQEVKGYQHPRIKHLDLYDLPGAETTKHPVATYFCDKRLYVFDCLLVVTAVRFSETDLMLAKIAHEKGTPVVFVRNKLMADFNNQKDHPDCTNMRKDKIISNMLLTMRNDIRDQSREIGIQNPKIFLIEAHSLRKSNNIKFEESDLLKYIEEIATVPT